MAQVRLSDLRREVDGIPVWETMAKYCQDYCIARGLHTPKFIHNILTMPDEFKPTTGQLLRLTDVYNYLVRTKRAIAQGIVKKGGA